MASDTTWRRKCVDNNCLTACHNSGADNQVVFCCRERDVSGPDFWRAMTTLGCDPIELETVREKPAQCDWQFRRQISPLSRLRHYSPIDAEPHAIWSGDFHRDEILKGVRSRKHIHLKPSLQYAATSVEPVISQRIVPSEYSRAVRE